MQTVTQAAINRVMETYGMITSLSFEQEEEARARVTAFLTSSELTDEHQLAVEGIKFLRGGKIARRRRIVSKGCPG